MITAGDLRELAIDHKELGSKILEPKSGEDVTFMKGGFKSADDDANIGANGTRINKKNRFPWSLECTIEENFGDLDYLQNLTESTIEATITATFMNGEIRVGQGLPVADISSNMQTGVMGLKFQGGGTFELI